MFQKATKKKAKARVAFIGPSGSGKTYTALTVARALGKRIAVIDTERGSASKYSGDVADFDVCELETFAPKKYIDALHFAAAQGYDVVVIDSLTHAWTGEGGLLDQKDKHSGKNSFDAWRTLTPQHNALVEAILGYPGHVIATMRVKTEYVIEEDARGKKVPRKVGLAPVQRDGLEYEFDVVADMDPDNCMHVSKSRCPALAGASIRKPGADVAKTLAAWLDDGVEAAAKVEKPAVQAPPRKVVETASGEVIEVPNTFAECRDAMELHMFAKDKREALAALVNGQRKTAAAKAMEAATRCGCDPFEVLDWCGLGEAA
jgi:DNA polymerase III delta prime subunit